MPRCDLPVELWLYVLSYLPPHTARRLLAVSRSLFQLGLDDLYGQINISFDDEKIRYRLNQLRHIDLCKRVYHLQISPGFLPSTRLSHPKASTELSSVKNWIRGAIGAFTAAQPPQTIFQLASSTLVRCPYIRQLTIILHDCDPSNDILAMLDDIAKSFSRKPQLETLVIDTPVSKLPEILQSLTQNPQSLCRLQDLEIILPATHQRVTESYILGFHSLSSIMSISKNTLRSFSFSSSLAVNLDKYLATLPWFTRLRSLTICTVITDNTFPTTDGLFSLIQKHAPQLEYLEVMPGPRQDPYQRLFDSGHRYELLFVVPESQHHHSTISQYVFSNLMSFQVGMPDHWHDRARSKNPLPPLGSIMPNLMTLALNPGFRLSFSALQDLIDGLPLHNGIVELKNLELSCHTLDLQVLDTLASRLPNLRSLAINYRHLSASDAPLVPTRTADVIWLPFVMALKTRRYTNWYIEELRITRVPPNSKCWVPHPALPAMAAVASSLPLGKQVYLDRSYKCHCVPE